MIKVFDSRIAVEFLYHGLILGIVLQLGALRDDNIKKNKPGNLVMRKDRSVRE